MNDHELLLMAAKAAGYQIKESPVFNVSLWRTLDNKQSWVEWNPLTDNGDALEFAVKLELQITLWQKYVRVWLGEVEAYEDYNDDPYAATRRAIVRAAAEIGKAMP